MTEVRTTPPTSDPDATLAERMLTRCLLADAEAREHVVAELCARHPDHAAELRTLWSRYLALHGAGMFRGREGDRLDDFQILSRLGEGGMGFVYLAEQVSLKRKVALKVLRPELTVSEASRERFRREARSIASLSHPGIVPVHAYGECGEVAYLAMEWVEGRSLGDLFARLRHQLPSRLEAGDLAVALGCDSDVAAVRPELFVGTWPEAVARIGAAVAAALDHAHTRGVMHRDVKPSNILIARDGRVLLADFGLAKTKSDQRLTRSGFQPGSLAYMAPEQVTRPDAELQAGSDVYSLGVTLYEMLTFALPFEAATPAGLMRKIVEVDVPRLRSRNRRLPRDLEAIVLKATDKVPRRRYASAVHMQLDLQRFLAGEPVHARLEPAWVRAARKLRRYWRGLGASLVLATVLALLANYWAAAHRRAKDERATRAANAADAALDRGVALLGLPLTAAGTRLREAFDLRPDRFTAGAIALAELEENGAERAAAFLDEAATRLGDAAQLDFARIVIDREARRDTRALSRALSRDDEPAAVLVRAWAARPAIARGAFTRLVELVAELRRARERSVEPQRLLDFEFALYLSRLDRVDVEAERREVAIDLERCWPESPRALVLAALVTPKSDVEVARERARRAWPTATGFEQSALLALFEPREAVALARSWVRQPREDAAITEGARHLAHADVLCRGGRACDALQVLDALDGQPSMLPFELTLSPRVVEAACMFEDGDVDGALARCSTSTDDVERLGLLLLRAKIYRTSRWFERARVVLEEATRLAPQSFEAWAASARNESSLESYGAALVAARRALELRRDAGVLSLAGRCHCAIGEPTEALRCLGEAASLAPERLAYRLDHADALREFGKPHRALELYEALLREAQEQGRAATPRLLRGAMVSAIQCGAFGRAREWLKQHDLMQSDADLSDPALASIGTVVRVCVGSAAARDRLRERALRPGAAPQLRCKYADCLARLGERDAAIEILRSVVESQTSPRPWCYSLARHLVDAKRVEEAIPIARAAAVADPNTVRAVYEVAHALGARDPDEAIALINRHRVGGRMTAGLYYLLGRMHMLRHRGEKRRASFPGQPERVDSARAAAAFVAALELDEDDVMARFRLTTCLRRLGFLAEARRQLASMQESRFQMERFDRVVAMEDWVRKEVELCKSDVDYELSGGRLLQLTAIASARQAEAAGRIAVAARLWRELWRQAEYGFDGVEGADYRFDGASCLVRAAELEPDAERAAALREQALAWFEQRLSIVEPIFALPTVRAAVLPSLRRWQDSAVFTRLRGPASKALPEEESLRWHQAFQQLAVLLEAR